MIARLKLSCTVCLLVYGLLHKIDLLNNIVDNMQ